jgi:hypothetical protein
VGADGAVWVIGSSGMAGAYGTYEWNDVTWVQHPGAPWVTNSAQQIFRG